jgi:hypothetical protein
MMWLQPVRTRGAFIPDEALLFLRKGVNEQLSIAKGVAVARLGW